MYRRRHCAARRPRQAATIAVLVLLSIVTLPSMTSTAGAATAAPTIDVQRGIRYRTAIDATGAPVQLELDVYRSQNLLGVRRPAVIWVHGGGFFTGSRSGAADQLVAEQLATRGFVVVSVDYRLRSTFSPFGPEMAPAARDATEDVTQAVRWLRANSAAFDVDPSRIGIAGASAGGIAALHVGHQRWPDPRASVQSVATLSSAGLWRVTPWPWAPSTLMVNGTADVLVPVSAARSTCSGLNSWWFRPRCTAMEVPAGHGLEGHELAALTKVMDHLVTTLRLDQTLSRHRLR
jgi:acetyl esterase/lipase